MYVIVHKDDEIYQKMNKDNISHKSTPSISFQIRKEFAELKPETRFLILKNVQLLKLTKDEIESTFVNQDTKTTTNSFERITDFKISTNKLEYKYEQNYVEDYNCIIIQKEKDLHVGCSCNNIENFLCEHLAYSLQEIIRTVDYRMAFDHQKRNDLLMKKANELGLENVGNLDDYFEISIPQNKLIIEPKVKNYDIYNHRFNNQLLAEFSNTDLISKSTTNGISFSRANRISWQAFKGSIDELHISVSPNYYTDFNVILKQIAGNVELHCTCKQSKEHLCEHMSFALARFIENPGLKAFFDTEKRNELFYDKAVEIGVDNEANLDEFFELEIHYQRIHVVQKKLNFLLLSDHKKQELEQEFVPLAFDFKVLTKSTTVDKKSILVMGYSKYNRALLLQYMNAGVTKEGNIKSPITAVNTLDALVNQPDPLHLPFLAAVTKYSNEYRTIVSLKKLNQEAFQLEIQGLKEVLKNPMELPVYYHNEKESSTITNKSIEPINVHFQGIEMELTVEQKDNNFAITAHVLALNKRISMERLRLVGDYFLRFGNEFILIDNLDFLRTIHYFKHNNNKLVVLGNSFDTFREKYLSRLESKVKINYSFIKPAPIKISKQSGLNTINNQVIYLTESDDYVLITPVVQYGDVEIPILSKRVLYTHDQTGEPYAIERNDTVELAFFNAIFRSNPLFSEQNGNDFFYLHKQRFLDEGWFLDAFETWIALGYTILGFSELKNNRLNQHKMKVKMTVNRGIDWFDVAGNVNFGDQKVNLKDIQKSVVNKTRYVQLGDGTLGILPDEWIEKFGQYFRSGEIKADAIRTHKSNFALIEELFEQEVLSLEVQQEIQAYKDKINDFAAIQSVKVPKKLKATLRDYQLEGLNWLHFLDEFQFGGCLADDMGLGKTIQIIAFILSQLEKGFTEPNLVVVPTSLLFNWQAEVKKFAPSLKLKVVYGVSREKNTADYSQFNIILTSYGTLLSDITHLKQFRFNYVFLDESQAIKNPESKRYKASRLLQSRNKIVLTGTPIENNTFDLFAQLSFANPGLLGTAKQFSDNYAIPIDKFQDTARAKELQRKINPFVLRRTKKQVAKELPEKTEMVIYCEMGTEQRKVYDSYKREFQEFLKGKDETAISQASMHILAGMTKLRQICNSPALLNDEAFYGESSSKLDELLEQIESKSKEHKILVFSQFVGMLDLIKKALDERGIQYNYLTGKTKNRQEQVEGFQENEDVRVFLISLKAGGTGLNLTEADYVFLVDPWWNPAVENQAIDRCYRIGQQKNVVAIRLICPDTIEDKIMQLQASKRELADDLIHTDANAMKKLSKADLVGLFG